MNKKPLPPSSNRPLRFEWLEIRTVAAADFGDAIDPGSGTGPGNYQTLPGDNGPYHEISGPTLGATVDAEPRLAGGQTLPILPFLDGQANSTIALGDNAYGQDEDGVNFASLLQPGRMATIVINVQGMPTAKLDAWIDYNQNGDFNDSGERLANGMTVIAGDNTLTVLVPADAVSGRTFARFRLSSAGALPPTGAASDGEVEDYAVVTLGENSLGVVRDAMLPHRYSNGVLRSSNSPSFYEEGSGKPWFVVDVYFSTWAARALIAGPNAGNGQDNVFAVADTQLRYWLSKIERNLNFPSEQNAVINRQIVDQNFQPLVGAVVGTPCKDAPTNQDCVYSQATIGSDGDDSALAIVMSLAAENRLRGGPTAVLNDPDVRASL